VVPVVGCARIRLALERRTTTVCGALKEGLAHRGSDLHFRRRRKGKVSRRTPSSWPSTAPVLVSTARVSPTTSLAAKVDSAADSGCLALPPQLLRDNRRRVAVVKQGMRGNDARRAAITGSDPRWPILERAHARSNDASGQAGSTWWPTESSGARTASTEFARQEPRVIDREIARVITMALRVAALGRD